MQIQCLFIFAALFSKSQQSGASLVESRNGSLSESGWSFTFSLFLRHFVGDILHVIDYERNIMLIRAYMYNNITSVIALQFNQEMKAVTLESLCGCNHCAEMLIKLHLYELKGKIYLNCKENTHINITKVNNNNREAVELDLEMEMETEIKNRTHIHVKPTSYGCLSSFFYNGNPVQFNKSTSNFMESCPRDCRAGICNEGQCRLLDASGPLCDCSTTALNGPFCDRDLREYEIASSHSIEIIDDDPNMKLKVSWKRFFNEKNCLLQFVHGNIMETLSAYGSYLIKGYTPLTKIDDEAENFLTVTIAHGIIEIYVNNKFIEKNQVYLKGSRIHIGFAKETKQCETFRGTFDLEIEGRGYHIPNEKQRVKSKPASTSWILAYCSGTIAVLIIIVIIIGIMSRRSGKTFTESPYDTELKDSTKKDKNMVDEGEYDIIEHDQLYLETRDTNWNTKSCIKKTPELPPRNKEQ